MNNNQLDDFSIYELRDLARKVGVFNPTVLKKSDLIKEILDINSGVKKPHIAKTKQGRPPKRIGGYNKLVDIFLPNDILTLPTKEEFQFENDNNNELTFCCDVQLDSDMEYQEQTFKGYLEILQNGTGLIRKKFVNCDIEKDVAFIHSSHIDELNLKAGDEIICKAVKVDKNKPLVFVNACVINGINIEEYKNEDRLEFIEIPINLNSKTLNLEDQNLFPKNFELKYGDTIFAYTDERLQYKLFVIDFIENLKSHFDNIILLNPSLKSSDGPLLENIPAEIFYADFVNTYSEQKRVGFLAINRAKRLAEMGKNVCLIIDDIYNLISLDFDFHGELPISKQIISSAKCLDNGSLTILAGFPNINASQLKNVILSTFPIVETVGLIIKDKKVSKESYRK